jgi:hypothetical protein
MADGACLCAAAADELVSLANDGAIGYAPRPEEIIGSLSIHRTSDDAVILGLSATADLLWAFESTGEYGSGEHTFTVTQVLVDAAE